MIKQPDKCPICLNRYIIAGISADKDGRGWPVSCAACGNFIVPRETWDDFLDPENRYGLKNNDVMRAKLSHKLRISTTSQRPILTTEYFRNLLDNLNSPTPVEQASSLIRIIGDHVSQTGTRLDQFSPSLYSEIGALNPTMAGELAIELVERRLIDGNKRNGIGAIPGVLHATLTLEGWEKYEAEKKGKFAGNYGFLAMKFGDENLDPFARDHIKPSIKERLGYELLDLRDSSRAGIIDNIMRAQIRDAAFVIADLTHDNYGAYWEAGYAEGLGKPVVYICEKEKFEKTKTHFDTNHSTTVPWDLDNIDQFKAELIATLRRTLNLFPER